jgi:transcription-repair coupling factor (superfamily II helicase)
VATAGIEYYLPLFFEETATVFDYLGKQATVVLHGDLEPAFQRFWQDAKTATGWVNGLDRRCRSLFFERRAVLCAGQSVCAAVALRTGQVATQFEERSKESVQRPLIRRLRRNMAVVLTFEDPLAGFKRHANNTATVLLLAESDVARKLSTSCAQPRQPPASIRSKTSRPAMRKDRHYGMNTGFSWLEQASTSSPKPALRSRSTTRRRSSLQEQVSDVGADQGLVRTERRRQWCTAPGISRYRGADQPGSGEKSPVAPLLREFCTSNMPTRPRCMCRSASCLISPPASAPTRR